MKTEAARRRLRTLPPKQSRGDYVFSVEGNLTDVECFARAFTRPLR